MSIKTDDKLIDAELTEPYMRGDSKYSTLYREIESEEVPPELDGIVIAEARNAIARRKGIAWKQLTPILAVAATTILTVSIVLRSGLYSADASKDLSVLEPQSPQSARPPESPAPVIESQAAPVRSFEPAAEAPEKRELAKAADVSSLAEAAKEKKDAYEGERQASAALRGAIPPPQLVREETRQKAAASGAQNAPASAPPASEMSEVVVSGSIIRSTPQDTALPVEVITSEDTARRNRAGPRETVIQPVTQSQRETTSLNEIAVTGSKIQSGQNAVGPRGTVPAPDSGMTLADRLSEKSAREENPERWLAYIRELRQEGKTRQADREWQNFAKRYPNYRVESNDAARPKATRQ